MSRWNKKDWAEVAIIFIFLAAAVVAMGLVGSLLMDIIFRLL